MAVNAQQYFAANPDVAQSFASNNYGMTPQAFADFHYENYGQYEQRNLAPIVQPQYDVVGDGESQQLFATGQPQEQQQNTVAQTNNQQYVKDYQGTEFDPATILKLSKQITASIDPNAIKGGVFSTKGQSVGFNYDEATRLLGKAPTATEQVVLDMARHLAKEGVTDLKDANLTETNRRFGSTFTGGGGTIYEIKKNAEGNPVISTWSKDTSNKKTILSGLAIAALAFGIPGVSEALLSSAPAGATLGSTAITAAEAAGLGLTAAEAASLGLSATEFAAASATAAGATGLLSGAAGGAGAFEAANAGVGAFGGTDAITGGLLSGSVPTGLTSAQQLAFELQNAGASGLTDLSATTQTGLLTGGKTAAQLAAEQLAFETQNAGASALTNTANTALTTTGLKTAAELAAEELAKKTAAEELAKKTAAEELAKKTATSVLVNEVTKAINPNTVSGLLQTGGSLLQSQQSKAAAEQAARDITAATQAGVTGSQFRPVGMTTRFGTSQYKYDPVTGQMISAGYQLTPEAKAQQDRLATMANYSLTQAENAQSQFAPLQTAAQNLYSLGSKYIAKSPEEAAQDYINKQMQLLQPSRELDLANLQNRLFQQGRTGVSVAQGGSLGATTPELQALYNARAMQDLQLSSQAQQAGQANTLFGSNLYDLGTAKLSNYFGGQVQAYQPYQAAMGQVQNLESLGQQPLQMGASLGQQASTAGANAGRLGLAGAQIAGGFNTSANATFNPYAGLLTAAGSPSSMFGQSIAKYLSGGSVTPFDALSSTKYGDGLAGYEKMIADIYGT